ncbi:MAG: nickel-dependent lactate racemase [Halanaerobiales bacterium]|nr:nickel-dependent lactate racemase [Halanaerobiales bacterium]
MKIDFLYPEIKGVEIPNKNFWGRYTLAARKAEQDPAELIRAALFNPIGAEPLEKRIKKGDQVLILADDNTRSTPVEQILKVLLPVLNKIGVRRGDIKILIALGTHRPMTKPELIAKLGEWVVEQYQVENHRWAQQADNLYYGQTARGIKVYGNKQLKAADLIIGLGHIVPHRVAGFSGGGKIVQPGVCTGETTGQTHWLSAQVSGEEIMGKRDNPVREEIDQAARLIGLDYIVNVVQNSAGQIIGVFAGDFIAAHRAGCELAREVYGVKIPQADIVITDSYPADLELWQAAKGIYTAELVLKKGGVVILVTPCPEGIATTHPEVEKYGYSSLARVKTLISSGQLTELSVAAHLVHVGRVIKEKGSGIMVSPGIPEQTIKKIGFIPADTVDQALTYALAQKGLHSSVIVLLNAGEMLPLVE